MLEKNLFKKTKKINQITYLVSGSCPVDNKRQSNAEQTG